MQITLRKQTDNKVIMIARAHRNGRAAVARIVVPTDEDGSINTKDLAGDIDLAESELENQLGAS